MGRGIKLQVKLSSRDRQQLEELLSGGLQPVRTILRALALRQLDLAMRSIRTARRNWREPRRSPIAGARLTR
jgi:hypothetical protein